jgi:chemotaxis protein MotB
LHGHANHERWLVSYADFITLLFAFFVVMFANSQVDRDKIARVSQSVRGALEHGRMPAQLEGFLGRSRDLRNGERGIANPGRGQMSVEELIPTLQQLSTDLAQEVEDGKIQVELGTRGLVITTREAAFFAPAGDTINAAAYPIIEKLAATINKLPNQVRMEGHTDSTPINTARFKSNWELSAARSIAMMELLTSKYGVPRSKVAIAGYADTVPLEGNTTAEGRSRNRRVDIVILNSNGRTAEPAPPAAPPQAAGPDGTDALKPSPGRTR